MADDLKERLDAIGEEEMYYTPASTYRTIQEAKDRIATLEAALEKISTMFPDWNSHRMRLVRERARRALATDQEIGG